MGRLSLSRERESERAEAAFRSNERAATDDDDVKGLSSSSVSVAAAHSCTHTRYKQPELDGERKGAIWREARCRFLWIEDRFSMAADLADAVDMCNRPTTDLSSL